MRPGLLFRPTQFLLAIFVSLGCSSLHAIAQQPENGFYRIAWETPKPDTDKSIEMSRSVGGKVWLTKLLSQEFGKARIWSRSNSNDRFRVMLQSVPSFDTKGQFALVIDGVCEVVSAHGKARGEGAQGLELIVDVHGRENVRKIAEELTADIQLRKHPGHQLLVSLVNTKREYRIGAPVELEMRIKNVGKNTVRFLDGGQQRGPRNNQFAFVSEPAIPDTGDAMNFGGMAAFRNLEPGETFSKKVDITKWFKFDKASYYEITGLFEMELHKESFGADYLWDETAVGRCRIQITD